MTTLLVTIVRWVDDHQPGWVECHLTDAFGQSWVFIEKAPVVSDENLRADTRYPRVGTIACVLLDRTTDDKGREVFIVDTKTPWGIEATSGETRFEVHREQVVVMHN